MATKKLLSLKQQKLFWNVPLVVLQNMDQDGPQQFFFFFFFFFLHRSKIKKEHYIDLDHKHD